MKTRCEFEQLICPTVATLKVGSYKFVFFFVCLILFGWIWGNWGFGFGERRDFGRWVWGKIGFLGGNGVENGERMDFFFVLFWGREREMGFVTIFVDGEDGWEDREKRGILVA